MLSVLKNMFFASFRRWKYKIMSSNSRVIGKPKLFHPLLLCGKGKITFGTNVQIGVVNSPKYYSHYAYIEARTEKSEIIIGNNVSLNNAFSAEANSKITIGNDVLIGVNCSMIDNDGHHLDSDKRINGIPVSKELIIEDNVFIGDNVTILKGVIIGKNSVIGNGSVVTKSFAENVIIAGNPAKIISTI